METKDLQNAILKVGKELHRICIENNIKYTMVGGTLLGASRHQGFIPWDDDMDIGMTWDEYNKFINVVSNFDHPWLTFDIPSVDNKSYGKLFIKAYDKNTTFIEWDKNEDAKGVFVDIFPIGYASNNFKDSILVWKKFQFIRALIDRKNYVLHKEFSLKDRFLRLLSSFCSHKYLVNKGISFINNCNKSAKKFSTIYDGAKYEIVKSDYYETQYKLYKFEDTEFYGISDANSYLTDVFGDYMQLPPESERIPHHFKFLDLYLPYAIYNVRRRK